MTDNYISAIDIGSHKIKVIVAEVEEENKFKIIGFSETPSTAIRKGEVMEIEKLRQDIEKAVEAVEMQTGLTIDNVYVGITGASIRSKNANHHIPITKKDKIIRKDDIELVLDGIKALNTEVGQRILHIIPWEYSVDEQKDIKEPPIGIMGLRLEIKAHLILAQIISIDNILRAVNKSGLIINDFVLSPYAASLASLTNEDKELGCCYIDIGSDLINILTFINGSLWKTDCMSFGSQIITNDIAYTLRISIADAEKLKVNYGFAAPEFIEEDEILKYSLLGDEKTIKSISKKYLAEIIEERLKEILMHIFEKVNETQSKLLPGGLIFGGGGSKIKGLQEFAKKIFAINDNNIYNIRINYFNDEYLLNKHQLGLEWAAAIGLIKYAFNNEKKGTKLDFSDEKNFLKNILKTLKSFIKDNFNI
ncbi:MAG TPA: cell division protein FtsA [bacterium]|nr:cell division protein FtsA [bacterium]HPQ18397.1 cell division protein FtsA [bacterium]